MIALSVQAAQLSLLFSAGSGVGVGGCVKNTGPSPSCTEDWCRETPTLVYCLESPYHRRRGLSKSLAESPPGLQGDSLDRGALTQAMTVVSVKGEDVSEQGVR